MRETIDISVALLVVLLSLSNSALAGLQEDRQAQMTDMKGKRHRHKHGHTIETDINIGIDTYVHTRR